MLNIHKRTTLLTALLALLFANGTIQAGNNYAATESSFSGAQCQPVYGNQASFFETNPDGIRNVSTVNRYISCSGLSNWLSGTAQADDDATTPTGQFFIWLSFDFSTVASSTTTYSAVCTISTRDLSSGVKQSTAVTISSKKIATPVLHNVASTQLSIFEGTSSDNWDVWSFNCLLPPQVKFLGFIPVNYSSTGGYYYTP